MEYCFPPNYRASLLQLSPVHRFVLAKRSTTTWILAIDILCLLSMWVISFLFSQKLVVYLQRHFILIPTQCLSLARSLMIISLPSINFIQNPFQNSQHGKLSYLESPMQVLNFQMFPNFIIYISINIYVHHYFIKVSFLIINKNTNHNQ